MTSAGTTAGLPEPIADRYEVGEQIGFGGQGAVYRAVDRATGQSVAVKVLHERFSDGSAGAQFQREVGALEVLRDTPGVIEIRDHGIADDRGWIVTELFPGTLADRVRSLGRLDGHEVRELGSALATTLAAVHDAGVLHRDLKPSNVFLRSDGTPVLGDFGVARIADAPTLTAARGASLGFVAPEVIENGTTSEASDLYGLGAILYSLLMGHAPHAETSASEPIPIGVLIRRIEEDRPVEFGDHVPADLVEVIGQLLAHEPSARPSSAGAVAEQLRRADADERAIGSTHAPTRSWHLPVLVAAGVAVLVGAVATFALWPEQNDPVSETSASTPSPTVQVSEPALPFAEREPEADVPATVECPMVADTSSVLVCETFDSLDGWDVFEQVSTAAIALDDGEVVFTPAPNAEAGSSHLERRVGALPESANLHVRARFLLEPGGTFQLGDSEEWWQNIFGVADESSNTWGAGVQWGEAGYVVDLSFADPPDNFGGLTGEPISLDTTACMELVLRRSDAGAPTMRINDQLYVEVPDAEARNYGDGYVVRVGPVWLDPRPGAPTLIVDEVVVATEPIGCP